MEKALLKAVRATVHYQGQFKSLAWNLFAQPIPLYQTLLKHLGKYGLALKDLKVEAVLADAHISAYLLDLSANLGIRLDRLEAGFLRLHDIGAELANNLLLDFYGAVQEADPSLELSQHLAAVSVDTQIINMTHQDLMQRYFKAPAPLADKAKIGMAFYFDEDASQGVREGNLVLDRMAGQPQGLVVKVTVAFDAQQVTIKMLSQRLEQYVEQRLGDLGLGFQAEGN